MYNDGMGFCNSAYLLSFKFKQKISLCPLVEDAVIWYDLRKLTATTSWQNLESPLYGTAVPFGLQLEWFITAESYQVVTLEVHKRFST